MTPNEYTDFKPKNRLRFVTATALFDGHDASINIMRRLLQSRGAEVIHLGHNRSAQDIARAAISEDAHAIAVSSYQGGHVEFFAYLRQLLREAGADHIRLFGGGGGVIVAKEVAQLWKDSQTKVYTPHDGQTLGLQGIIGHMLSESDRNLTDSSPLQTPGSSLAISRGLSLLEAGLMSVEQILKQTKQSSNPSIPVVGITGSGGAGKSSLTDELLSRFLWDYPELRIGVLCVDPSKRKTGGALLGDRIRMNTAADSRIYVRSFATRGSGSELAKVTQDAIEYMRAQGFDLIIVETSGIGQGDAKILELSNVSIYVMTAEFGAQSQLEKIDMLDFADLIAINKFERPQALDAIRDVRTTLRRSRFQGRHLRDEEYPVFGTIASRFADDGTNGLFRALLQKLNTYWGSELLVPSTQRIYSIESNNRQSLIPGDRQNYLAEIAKSVRSYHDISDQQANLIGRVEAIETVLATESDLLDAPSKDKLTRSINLTKSQINPDLAADLNGWDNLKTAYYSDEYTYSVRGKPVKVDAMFTTLSHLKIPRVCLPPYKSKQEIARFLLKENIPGKFPYTGGVFPFRRRAEDPQRMFAGEGGPHRTNKRFKLLSEASPAIRLSTAFDSVTLYGSDPFERPDIYGKVGESGVSIATLQDMKDLYAGFDLCAPNTSVSMTINGPAPIILAFFLNAAIDQSADKFVAQRKRIPTPTEHAELIATTLENVRGTVQADILKEDQAQNTCIFSTEFALKMMADVQEYFILNKVRNYYSVSISGYHIAEAGANPISQLAFTLANGFTYVEYYLARGMNIDDFAPNLSFFFSNGVDAEYAVLGRVARRIWAIAMRDRYNASDRSQMLKYHIQTSGRSLHAQEIDFNDIRTTLQALIALYDNCNSLHTNAYDEAITTPTEESVRRALAIQMIINKEFGPNRCENVNQGSYFIEQLTDLVEEAVLKEFERISVRGGVLSAMETQYQRSRIQEESLYYETLKDSGELQIVGVNMFLRKPVPSEGGLIAEPEIALARASYDEKDAQILRLRQFQSKHATEADIALKNLADVVISGKNIFAELMKCARVASLGQITDTLYRVGGQYRRAM